jgi:hypothetical protein
MRRGISGVVGLAVGLVLGVLSTWGYMSQPRLIQAGTSDRFEDYVMVTGAVAVNPRAPTDGVWLLDYRSGKLLATVIDRNLGKITGWAEMDLVAEFGLQPRQNVHFMMTTGNIALGQAALYLVETTSGKFGVYSLGTDATTIPARFAIRRHDLGFFRAPEQKK